MDRTINAYIRQYGERVLWYVFLVVLSWQSRVIVWQADVVFSEWRSLALWGSDIVFLLLFFIALWRTRGRLVRTMDRTDWLLGGIVGAALLSLIHTDVLIISVYQIVRLCEGILFYFYLRHYAFRRFDADHSVLAYTVGVLFQAGLGIAQVAVQHDIGMRFMGETALGTTMHGIAVFYTLTGSKFLRAYGSLPHPNVLAVYLLTACACLYWLYLRHEQRSLSRRESLLASLIWGISAWILVWALYFTFSRTVIAAWVAFCGIIAGVIWMPAISNGWQNISRIRHRTRSALLCVGTLSLLFLILFWPLVRARMTIAASDESIQLRVVYARDAIQSGGGGRTMNWTGVGIGNFPTWLSQHDQTLPSFLWQPAHNIYLLAYAEIGIVGALIWIGWLVTVVVRAWRNHAGQPLIRLGLLGVLGAFFFIGLWDHFFWTLQQGRLLWWVALALAVGY